MGLSKCIQLDEWESFRERFHYDSWIFKFIANIFVEMEDYLELQSLFHLCKVYIYTDSIETFTTFTVNRVGISHQIESYDNLFNFQRKKEKKIRKKFIQIFPKNSKKLKLFQLREEIWIGLRLDRKLSNPPPLSTSSPAAIPIPIPGGEGSVLKWFFPQGHRVAKNTLSLFPPPPPPS